MAKVDIKNNIISIVSEVEITESYLSTMKQFYPTYSVTEPVYRVVCRVNAYGVEELKTETWTESQLKQYKEQGFYFGKV